MVDLQYVFHRAHKLRALTRAGCTNSASATASVRFFKRLANRLGAMVSISQTRPTGQPTASGSNWHGRFPAGHRYQPCFTFAVQSLLTPTQLLFAIQSRLDPLLHTALGFARPLTVLHRRAGDVASDIPPSERDSSLFSRMRAWVSLYAAARPRETKALSSCCSSVVSLTVLLGRLDPSVQRSRNPILNDYHGLHFNDVGPLGSVDILSF